MSFRRRNFNEVLDNLLTRMVGGVAAETHAFPPNDDSDTHVHVLDKPPARQVVSIYGVRNGQSTAFSADTDFELSEDGLQVLWREGGQRPDNGTVIAINYVPRDSIYNYNDLYVGSVTRTMAEAVGLEIAQTYAQMDGVYKAGFVDTANGSALDHVVSLLGINRVTAGRFQTELEFSRVSGTHGDIYLPAGTRVLNEDASIEYETTTTVTLADGQNTVVVNARDVEDNPEGLDAGTLTVLAKPIAGISGVTNKAPTTLANRNESDDELRTRAKHFLHGSERATVASIEEAVRLQGVQADIVEEEALDSSGEMRKTGVVRVIPHAEVLPPDQRQRIVTAINQVRPAGVNVFVANDVEVPVTVDFSLRIITRDGLLEQDVRNAHDNVRKALTDYFDGLAIKEPGSVNRLVGLVMGVPEIEDLEIVAADLVEGASVTPVDLSSGQLGVAGKTTRLGTVELIDRQLPTQLRIVITHPSDQIPSQSEIESTYHQALTSLNSSSQSGSPIVTELSRELLLFLLPLPIAPADKAFGTLTDFGAGPGADDASVSDFDIEFIFIDSDGLSELVLADGDAYSLSDFEQISLAGVELTEASTGDE